MTKNAPQTNPDIETNTPTPPASPHQLPESEEPPLTELPPFEVTDPSNGSIEETMSALPEEPTHAEVTPQTEVTTTQTKVIPQAEVIPQDEAPQAEVMTTSPPVNTKEQAVGSIREVKVGPNYDFARVNYYL